MWKWQGFGLYSAQAPQDVSLRVCCAGDNLIHLSLLGDDLSEISLYDEIAPVIREADISVINLETILVDDIRKISDYPRFGTPLVVGEALAQAGFDVINLANNHVLDQGDYGLRTTTAFFKEKGIPCFGACAKSDYRDSVRGRMLLVEKSGVRIAFLGYTYGTNGIDLPEGYPYLTETFSDPERMGRQLDYARSRADVVIVYAHWGTEYKKDPDEEQILFAKLMAEHGADVVIGCHPHVLQESSAVTPEGILESGLPVKITEGDHMTAVYFSLGNFIAAQSGDDTKTGGLAEFTIEKRADGSVSIGDFDLVKTQIVKSDAGYRVTLK